MYRNYILSACFLLLSAHVLGQAEDPVKEPLRFIVEPYTFTGLMRVVSDVDQDRLIVIPGLNLGLEIRRTVSILLGVDHFTVDWHHVICNPCINPTTTEIIDVSLGARYKVFEKKKFSVEPFANFHKEFIVHQINHFQVGGEGYSEEDSRTPYANQDWIVLGTYFNYSVLKMMNLFIAPTFRVYYPHDYLLGGPRREYRGYDFMAGSRVGTTFYF